MPRNPGASDKASMIARADGVQWLIVNRPPTHPHPAAAAPMSRRHFMKKFPLLFPALRVLSKFVHLIR